MKPKKTAMIMFSAAIVMALSASGVWAGKAGQTTPSPTSIVKQKTPAAVRHPSSANPIAKGIRPSAQPPVAAQGHLRMPDRTALRWKASSAGFRGHVFDGRVNDQRGGIKPVESGPGLMPEHARRIKDKLAMENARFRDIELGLTTPLPGGVDSRRIPGHGGPDRSGEEGLDTSYPPGDRAREEQIAAAKRQLREAGAIPPDGMDERTTGLMEFEDGEYEWIEGDTRMGPDDENVTWGTLEPVDSDTDDGGGKGTKDTDNAGDEDVMDEDAANVEKDPEPEGDDPDEVRSPTSQYREVLVNTNEAFRMQGAARGDGRGGSGGGPESDPSEQQRRKKLNDIWGATHVVPYVVGPVDPEDGGPDEAGSPVMEGVAEFAKGYANQPAPGGEDPDDPRAGQSNRPVRGRATFGEHQSDATTRMIAGQNFSPAVGDPGDPTGPDGPEY